MKKWEVNAYKSLACAVIRQAVYDYVYEGMPYYQLERFIKNSVMVDCLDLDKDNLLELAQRKKRRVMFGGKKKKCA